MYEILCICCVYIPLHVRMVLHVDCHTMHDTRNINKEKGRTRKCEQQSDHQLYLLRPDQKLYYEEKSHIGSIPCSCGMKC